MKARIEQRAHEGQPARQPGPNVLDKLLVRVFRARDFSMMNAMRLPIFFKGRQQEQRTQSVVPGPRPLAWPGQLRRRVRQVMADAGGEITHRRNHRQRAQ